MADLGPLAGALLELIGPALSVLLRSALGMAVLSLLLSIASFFVAAQGSTGRGVLAVLLSLLVGAILGGILAVKRAVLSALHAGLARLGLGRRALDLVFSRLLGASLGAPGTGVAGLAERLPLAEAERRLRGSVAALLAEGEAGWLRRRLRARLLESVERVTLARFRAEGASGVDLAKVRDELGEKVDGLLSSQVSAVLTKLTLGLVLGTAALSLGAALLIRRLPL